MKIRIAIGQINSCCGDLATNSQLILQAADKANLANANLLLTPALSLVGSVCSDLNYQESFVQSVNLALEKIAKICYERYPHLTLVVGLSHCLHQALLIADNHQHNLVSSAAVLQNGKIVRIFSQTDENFAINIDGCKIALQIGQRRPKNLQADLLCLLDNAVYVQNKSKQKIANLVEIVENVNLQMQNPLPIVYVNAVGATDGYIFDGNSLAINKLGKVISKAKSFDSDFFCVDFINSDLYSSSNSSSNNSNANISNEKESKFALEAEIWNALVLGIRDYVRKNKFQNGVVLGLSGGIDSALVMTLAVDALGAENVAALVMPSPYTAQMSIDDAHQLAKNLGVSKCYDVPISPSMETFAKMLSPIFEISGVAAENIQARTRGNLLMAYSNQSGALVLTTGNKSESAVGYCTLYGDMAGGLAVISDVYKTMVYRLANYKNEISAREIIPKNIIVRPPSAELKPNQKDQDSLPDYDILDAILESYIEKSWSPNRIIAELNLSAEIVEKVITLLHRSEYKRKQAAVGLNISSRSLNLKSQWDFLTGKAIRYEENLY